MICFTTDTFTLVFLSLTLSNLFFVFYFLILYVHEHCIVTKKKKSTAKLHLTKVNPGSEIRLALIMVVLFTDPRLIHPQEQQQMAVSIRCCSSKHTPVIFYQLMCSSDNMWIHWPARVNRKRVSEKHSLFLEYYMFVDARFRCDSSVLLNYKVKWTN